jgi:hypothetical protein
MKYEMKKINFVKEYYHLCEKIQDVAKWWTKWK